MKIIEKIITLKDRNLPLKIIPFHDIHIGSTTCLRNQFEALCRRIKDEPNTYIIGLGDYAECITMQDNRYDTYTIDRMFINKLDDLPMEQIRYLKKFLFPIRDRIIMMSPGNHEDSFRRKYNIDLLYDLCHYLNVPKGDYMNYIRIKFDREQYHTQNVIMWTHHGWFGSRKRGAKVNNIEDIARGYEADIYIVGHSHDKFSTSNTYASLNGNSLILNDKVFCNAGSLSQAINLESSGYAERKGYFPTNTGIIEIDITPRLTGKPLISRKEIPLY